METRDLFNPQNLQVAIPPSHHIIGHRLNHEEAGRVEEALRGGAAHALHQADQVLQ